MLALDLDGTLLNTQKEVTAENKAALRAARDKGVHVVITTGRPLQAIEHILEDLDMISETDYSITFNGGLVQRNTGYILDKSELTRNHLNTLVKVMKDLSLPMDIISDGTVYSLANGGHHSIYHLANPMLDFVVIDSLDDIPVGSVYNKVVIVFEADYLDAQIPNIPAQLYEQFEIFKSRDIILEIMPKDVHKAAGLDLLIKHLGIEQSQVMAMGDEENDLTMLEWAGWGVAMANGVDVVKKVAKAVTTKTNEESGVAEAVHKYILES